MSRNARPIAMSGPIMLRRFRPAPGRLLCASQQEIRMAFEDWETRPDGNLAVCPLAGYQTANLPPLAAVRLEYYENEQAFDARRVSAVQLHMNADQAEQLAQALLRTVASIRERPKGPGH
jgi:hypothetical protein